MIAMELLATSEIKYVLFGVLLDPKLDRYFDSNIRNKKSKTRQSGKEKTCKVQRNNKYDFVSRLEFFGR